MEPFDSPQQSRYLSRAVLTWACSVSSVIQASIMGSLALLMTLGFSSDSIIRFHEGAMLLFALVVLYLAPLTWVVLLCIRRFRMSPAVHLTQIGVYTIGWLLTFGAGIWLEYQNLPGWFLD